jgi:VanZ family protein
VLQAGLLFVLSAQPDLRFADEPDFDFVIRKVGHFAAYAVLGALVAWALGMPTGDRRRAAVAIALVCGYAVTDELHQALVPGRHASPVDVAIDTLGGGVGLVAFRFVATAVDARVARLRRQRL